MVWRPPPSPVLDLLGLFGLCCGSRRRAKPMDPLLPLERFAALSAEIEAGAPPDAILDREGLSLEQWAAFEAMWRARIEEDIAQGSFDLTNRYNAAFVARRNALRYEPPARLPAPPAAYAADPSMQPVPTPRMLYASAPPPAMVADPLTQPVPTPRMPHAPAPPPAVGVGVAPAEPATLPPRTPRMVQAPEPPPGAYDDRPTPIPDTLRPGMITAAASGNRATQAPSRLEDRVTGPDETSPPSSLPVSTPRQEVQQEGPRFDGLPFRPAPAAGADIAPRSTNDLSGVLPFKPAAGNALPAAAIPSPAPPTSQASWSGAGTGTVKMTVIAGPAAPSPPPAEPEPEIAAPLSPPPPPPPVSLRMPAISGPPVLTGPGRLAPAPVVFPFALWRRAEPQAYPAPAHVFPAYAPAPYAPPAHAVQAPALPAHSPPAPALPPHSVPGHALPAHLPAAQAPQALSPQGHAPPARPSQPGFPAVAPPASPTALPPVSPPTITAGPSSTRLGPASSRHTLPPNIVTASPVVPFKAAAEAPVTYSVATAAGFPPPTPYVPPGAAAPPAAPSFPAAAAPPPAQPPGLAVPAVLGASSSRLSLEQYASLSAEVAISPGTSAAVRARYGLDENAYVAETGYWQRCFSANKELFTRYSALYQSYREWFSRSAR